MSINILNERYFYYKEPIGHGSFSTIYKGSNYKDDTKVAIKKIMKVVDKEQLLNEVSTMKKFSHKNIIEFYDYITTRRDIFFVLEYCNEGDLGEYIASEHTEFDNKYFYEIIAGLRYLHKRGILHRDIKPQNILIHNKTVKISDFGFAKAFEKNDLITTFCGSPLYMAPEIITSHEYNSLSDIWSLGVVLYELLTKQHPYNCDTKKELWGKFKDNTLDIDFNTVHSTIKRAFIMEILVVVPEKRLPWNTLFERVEGMRERSNSYVKESQLSAKSKHIQKPKNILNSSVNITKNSTKTYCDVVSRSAPTNLTSHYVEHYMETNPLHRTNSIPRLGDSIPVNTPPSKNYLSQSIRSLRKLFW